LFIVELTVWRTNAAKAIFAFPNRPTLGNRANAQQSIPGAILIPNRGQTSGGIYFGLRRHVAAVQSADVSAQIAPASAGMRQKFGLPPDRTLNA
jgi:hypothetical protein